MTQRSVRFTTTAQRHVEREKAWWLENRIHTEVFAAELEAVASRLSEFQNPKVGKICELLGAFDPALAATWREALSDEQADAIDSIVSNRNQIAHGRSIGLSFDVWNRYYKSALQALARMELHFTL